MKVKNRKPGKGLTLIEVLVLVAVLAVLAAFTNPILRDRSARAAVKEATVQVALALHNAKNSARASNTHVTVLLTTNQSDNTISFEFPDFDDGDSSSGAMVQPLPDVALPGIVSIDSNAPALTFSPQGTVSITATIQLAAAAGTDLFAYVMLNSLQGRVKTRYGLRAGSE